MKIDVEDVYKKLIQRIPKEQVLLYEPMKKHTSFRIGGPADIMVMPSKEEHIQYTIFLCKELNIPLFVMGNGTNLLVRDKGIRGVVIKIADYFSQVHVEGEYISAQAGLSLSAVSKRALRAGLSGLEFAAGIPGTLGGAVTMNAGAYDGEMKDVVEWVRVVNTADGNEYILYAEDLKFGYRSSRIQKENLVVLSVGMKLTEGDYGTIKAKMEELSKRRREKQPLSFPSAGSIFKRPKGYYAGKLIQDAGLKGMRIGDAQVSPLHAGFIVNLGNATAKDVIGLIELIKNQVKEKFGVDMCLEVKIVGDE